MKTTTIKTGNSRLLKLAKHLEKGKLGHKKFDFSAYNSDLKLNHVVGHCGTSGCALGEAPIVWPKLWEFGENGPKLIKATSQYALPSPSQHAVKFFGITYDEFWHLFLPRRQKPSVYGGRYLNHDATRNEVAANIRIFVKQRKN